MGKKDDPFANIKSYCNCGTLENPKHQLRFHADVHGEQVEFDNDHRVARRKPHHSGIAFSSKPIVVGECVAVEIRETTKSICSFFHVGSCTTNPMEIPSEKLR